MITAQITIHCERVLNEHSSCGTRASYPTSDIGEARGLAYADGWTLATLTDGDYCPRHGRPA